jgi:hypothetical protein
MMGSFLSELAQPGFPQRERRVTDHDMIQYLDAHDLAGPDELAGDFEVFRTRGRITRRMVVTQDYRGRPVEYRRAKAFAGMDEGRADRPDGNEMALDHFVLRIERYDDERLLREIPHVFEKAFDGVGCGEHRTVQGFPDGQGCFQFKYHRMFLGWV